MATSQWISDVADWTMASWYMIGNATLCIKCAYSRARIFAFIINASEETWTIAIYNALWSTTTIWITEIFWQTFACSSTAFLNAFRIGTAWIWCAGMLNFITNDCWKWIIFGKIFFWYRRQGQKAVIFDAHKKNYRNWLNRSITSQTNLFLFFCLGFLWNKSRFLISRQKQCFPNFEEKMQKFWKDKKKPCTKNKAYWRIGLKTSWKKILKVHSQLNNLQEKNIYKFLHELQTKYVQYLYDFFFKIRV